MFGAGLAPGWHACRVDITDDARDEPSVARKRQTYPPARTSKVPPRPGAGPEGIVSRPNLVAIDLNAAKGREGLSVGDRVRIGGTGRYAGELVVIERINAGVIPSAVVRTEGGETRHVRTIDLEPVRGEG
jgi:hypothetical protein